MYDKEAFVVIPRVDLAQISLRSTLETAARTVFASIAHAVGKKMLVIQLGIERRINIGLRMIHIVDVVQHVLPRIGRAAIVARQCEIILKEARVVDLDVPVRVLVASVPADVVRIAPRLAAVVLLRLHYGICAFDVAVQILCIAFQTEVEGIVLICLVAANQSKIRCLAVVA